MNQAFHLYQLQKVDTQIGRIQARIDEIDAIITRDERIVSAENGIHKARLELEKLRKTLREYEETGRSIRLEIETNEASMYSGKIRNPKELSDLQSKVNSDKKKRDQNEDAQIEGMLKIETQEALINSLTDQLHLVQSEVATSQSLLLGEKSQLQKQKETLEVERSAKLTSIPKDQVETYLRLMKQKRGTAVAKVDDRTCEACGAPLTAGEWQTVRSSAGLSFCSTCGRILYAN